MWLGGDYYLGYWVLHIHCISGSVCRCVVRGRLLPGVLPALGGRESGTVVRSPGSDAQLPLRDLPAVRRARRHERERAARLPQAHQPRKYLMVYTGSTHDLRLGLPVWMDFFGRQHVMGYSRQ